MVSDTIERIREHLRQPGVFKSKLAEQAGLHANTLAGVERDDWNPTADTLKKLEAVLPAEAEPAEQAEAA
jgi:3,4-dihydroxy 2-butanone 4-phosphate synthase / GTP cyclohydrolase II